MIPVAAPRKLAIEPGSVSLTASLPGLQYALRGLALQPELPFPVCFLLDGDQVPSLRAEVARVLPAQECEKLAREALDAAIESDFAQRTTRPRDERAASLPRESADLAIRALEERGLAWERSERGLSVRGGDGLPGAARIVIEPCGSGQGVQLSATATLRLADASGLHAMARYALELNHRLRLARVAVDGTGPDAARVVWQSVLPGSVPLERGLVPAVEALAVARNLSSRVFAALSAKGPAAAYLNLRFRGESSLAAEVASTRASRSGPLRNADALHSGHSNSDERNINPLGA